MAIIEISVVDVKVKAELNDNPTSQAIVAALPLEGTASVWGEEIYFDIPVTVEQAPDAHQDVEVGELGYWPVGKAFCIFFGPTPVSTGRKPRAYSPVNVFGKVLGDATVLRNVADGSVVRVEKAPG